MYVTFVINHTVTGNKRVILCVSRFVMFTLLLFEHEHRAVIVCKDLQHSEHKCYTLKHNLTSICVMSDISFVLLKQHQDIGKNKHFTVFIDREICIYTVFKWMFKWHKTFQTISCCIFFYLNNMLFSTLEGSHTTSTDKFSKRAFTSKILAVV